MIMAFFPIDIKKCKKKYLSIFFLVLLVFVFSIYLFPYYIAGDQEHYRYVYYELSNISIKDGYIFYNENLSSYEFVHFLIVWLFSGFFEKDILMSFFNAFLSLSVINFMRQRNVSFFIVAIVILSNYYLFVNYFSAERLKFGLIFFFLSLSCSSKVNRSLFALVTVFSHVQFIIIYASLLANSFIKGLLRFIALGKIPKYALFSLFLIFCLFFFLREQIVSKFLAYYSAGSIANIYKLLVFYFLSLFYSQDKKKVLLSFLPLIFVAYFIGDSRINMFGYFIFMYYALQVNRGFNLGVIFTSAYFSYKTYVFCLLMIKYGNPFYLEAGY